jgi:pantoate--beta-alanine ligase
MENEMYEDNEPMLEFDLGTIDKVMEGEHRPGHFKGVVTIVCKFFELVKPTRAYFGEKDFQQLAVIRLMTKALFPQIKIIACPTMRESDGLAMSSRNLLLTSENRNNAPLIFKTLNAALLMKQKNSVHEIKNYVQQKLSSINGFKPEYFEIVNAETLQSIHNFNEAKTLRACIAVWAGNVRLIDNIAF